MTSHEASVLAVKTMDMIKLVKELNAVADSDKMSEKDREYLKRLLFKYGVLEEAPEVKSECEDCPVYEYCWR